ncbi:hypothetical protein DMN91_007319 [Ooceraea biroi]|uniref:N-acetyltransferase ESCO1 n=1 Tax=Ooceraea biroi TaxID=2015173 RepID=A0A026W5T4_OOCBI|nr:N-acetyltransferase ESCO2 [Ooceraea biroi]XP_011343442.1 N-acetyltransferase ESCO2 [Ooceraea biroi]EZA51430.1 N-acetyltransferase ESCO1 [Ooceraea biroi]RLU20706.1 hypothetical protein DMN91_007319 [Ooceraea biroi]
MEIDQEESLCTPRRVQKCLFASFENSLQKRNVLQDVNYVKEGEALEEESDLGPMSPLAFTDRSPSTSDSSSRREYVSPLTTPEKSSCNKPIPWDRLTSRCNSEVYMSPFSSLKKVARSARYSPRCKIFNENSSKLLPSTPEKLAAPLTPQRSKIIDAMMDNVVPETPQGDCAAKMQDESITETPRKSRSPKCKLLTPLSSMSKTAPLPKLHKRKSLGTLETGENISPEQKENTLKRKSHEQLAIKPAKLFKSDDISAPKARAALFQEETNECDKLENFSLSTKTFYSNHVKTERPFVFGSLKNSSDVVNRRRSLPVQGSSYRRSLKKERFGRINAGVFHGIKKPKPKVNLTVLKKEETEKNNPTISEKSLSPSVKIQFEVNATVEKAASSEIDESKRFFKTNKTVRLSHAATVAVNNKSRLKVTDGKIASNQKQIPSATNTKRQSTVSNISLDATDLTVDEPEAMLQQDKVADLLKILEDDWEDDYDTMEPLTNSIDTVSPSKSVSTLLDDPITSPTSELSNMTSTMNIEDTVSVDNKDGNRNAETSKEEPEKRYFPLFTKGYSIPDTIFEEPDKSTKMTKRNIQWQLSEKAGGAGDQYQLDAGQKQFGATQCPECNIVYQLGDAEDENAHLNYHNSIRILKFHGWKNERVIIEDPFTSSRIILVEPHDSKHYWKKVLDILSVVDRDLGLSDIEISNYRSKRVLLYIREKNVLGVLVAESIKMAHRMIPELIDLDCCTAESTPTKCGINVVWTAMSHRRQGIATKLVDTLRAKYFYGYVMSLDDIAFSIPTPSGKIFAEKYTKTRNFKVYN